MMRMAQCAIAGCLFAAGASGCVPQRPTAAAVAGDSVASVTVSPTEARIVVPVDQPPGGWWSWYAPATPMNQMEYQWAVDVTGAHGKHSMGYTLFKGPSDVPDAGGFRALVKAGQVNVWLESPTDGTAGVTRLPIRVSVERARLVFTLPSRATVDQVFDGHPSHAVLTRVLAGQTLPPREVPISYVATLDAAP